MKLFFDVKGDTTENIEIIVDADGETRIIYDNNPGDTHHFPTLHQAMLYLQFESADLVIKG